MRERPQPASAPSELVIPVDRQRGLLGGAGALDQGLGARLLGIEHVEDRPVAGDLVGVGQPAKRVLGHRLRHRQRALDQFGEHLGRPVARRHHRLPLANEDAQPEVLAFRALQLLGLAEAAGVRQRDALDQHRVGGIGAGFLGAGDEILQQVDVVCRFLGDFSCRSSLILEEEFTTRQ